MRYFFCIWTISSLYLLYFIFEKDNLLGLRFDFTSIWTLITAYLLLFAYSQIIFLSSLRFHKALRALFLGLGYLLFFTSILYCNRMRNYFDMSVFIENSDIIVSQDSFGVILHTFKNREYIYMLLTSIIVVYYSLGTKLKLNPRIWLPVTSIVFFLGLPLAPKQFDPYLRSLQSAYDHFLIRPEIDENYQIPKINFTPLHKKRQPNIIVVALESFNGLYINRRNEHGKEFTPEFNRIAKKSFSVRHFYGNSVQTVKGLFAIFCSQVPFIQGKASYDLEVFPECLPSILKRHGYETIFYQGAPSYGFDNMGSLLQKTGFSQLWHSECCKEADKKYFWGWGLQDDKAYQVFFKRLRERKTQKPFFASMITLSHHMRFREVPPHLQKLYPGSAGKGRREMFLNSLHAADSFLKSLMLEVEKLAKEKDTLLLILADHSYPSGLKGSYSNETGYYNDNFRIPFLIYWKGPLSPALEKHRAHSQLDIAPTLLDLLGIRVQTYFFGRSMFQTPNPIIPLVQPYSGRILGLLKFPYKYVYKLSLGRTELFDLMQDSSEDLNIVDSLSPEQLEEFSKWRKTIFSRENALLRFHTSPPAK